VRRLVPLGALLAAIVPAAAPAAKAPPAGHAARSHALTKAGWLHHVLVTEYYPAPEAWFVGKKVAVPGLRSRHRIDWLYSATGVSMEGEGIGLDGRTYHIDALGQGGWVDAEGHATEPGRHGWSGGPPYWRDGAYWLTHTRALTFPLEAGGWSNGRGKRYVPLPGVSFAPGHAKPLRFWRSIAVDPRLIPLGSRVYIPAYAKMPGGGWFRAQDTGGAIDGRHVDVYRPPPAVAGTGVDALADERIYVIPPGAKPGRGAPSKQPPPAAPPTTTTTPPPPTTTSTSGGAGDPAGGGTPPAGGAGAP
jgi:3D (Asp-Asp-Asp) domain-containing protein